MAQLDNQSFPSSDGKDSGTIQPLYFPDRSYASEAHTAGVYGLALTSSYLISASKDTTIRIWSLETQRLVHPPLEGHFSSVLCVAASEPLDLIFSSGADCRLIIWRLSTGERLHSAEKVHSEGITTIAISSKYLATGSKDCSIKVWDLDKLAKKLETTYRPNDTDSSKAVVTLTNNSVSPINSVLLTERCLIAGSADGTITVWETSTWDPVRTMATHSAGISCLAISPDETKIVGGSSDHTLRIFDLTTGSQELRLTVSSSLVRSVCVPPGERSEGLRRIISGSYDGAVHVWERKEGNKRFWKSKETFHAKDSSIESDSPILVFKVLSDGQRVYCASQSGSIVAWMMS
ncbi:WD40 repeat-like protein [Corynespora cassiicola Philippines]|uniref:WD40 repeat-like protein n=1 Tax=Corynespora cassiicola Philippines TaxID=1448308 RepID=A0A2T2NHQ2_CORCC|nr:WD40 repeat-like protein [Corynespora cassiicola Philippines]